MYPRGHFHASIPTTASTVDRNHRCACLSLHSGFRHQTTGPVDGNRRPAVSRCRSQTDWASSEQDRRPTYEAHGRLGFHHSWTTQLLAVWTVQQAVIERVVARVGWDGCCALQGSCFEKGMAPNAVMRCRQARGFVLSQQQQATSSSSICQHPPGHPCEAAAKRRGGGGGGRIVGPPPPSPTIAVHHKHEQQAGSDGYASASWEGCRIPPSPPRHDGSEIQGRYRGERRGHWHDMAWHGWDEMMARPLHHTSMCFTGRLATLGWSTMVLLFLNHGPSPLIHRQQTV